MLCLNSLAVSAPLPSSPDREPVLLPIQRPTFMAVPDKPPLPHRAARIFLSSLEPILKPILAANSLEVNDQGSPVKSPSLLLGVFVPRPLQRLVFGQRLPLHHSIILLIDGILFACFRVRLERDVCAASRADAFCSAFGTGVSPASTFCGLYMPPPDLLRAVLHAVKLERGYGVFIGPITCNAWDLLQSPGSTSSKAELLCFTFHGPDALPWRGVFCSFAYQSKVKRKKPDVLFALSPILHEHVPRTVMAIPFCPARVSALPHIPKLSDDTAKRSLPLDKAIGIPQPVQSVVWNTTEMVNLAALFPYSDVASLFIDATSPQGAHLHFVGDRTKHVVNTNGDLEPAMVSTIRQRFMCEVSKNRMMGPFSRCPFPNDWCLHQARITPLDTRKKDKYDPLSERFRVISNFSAGRLSSINNLIYSPKLMSTHLQCAHIRDALFNLGPNARFDAIDQEDAFRADHINLSDAHLYCYLVGKEWFIDLRDPFGNIKSEYTYAVVVAVLKWAFECDTSIVSDGSMLLGYVDNWFLLSKASCPSHDSRWEQLKRKFKLLGAPMHEEQRSTEGIVNALGWDWDPKAGLFSCPEDKYQNCLRLTLEWSKRAFAGELFSFVEIDSLAGLFQWISTACPAIISSVASIQALKHKMKRAGLQSHHLDARSKSAVMYLADFFATWSKSCPLFAGFSPAASWEVLIKVDASTDFGTGGFCLPSFANIIHEWLPEERALALAHKDQPIRESTTFFELLGIRWMLSHFALTLRGKRVQIECDNEAAIRDLVCCFSGKPRCMQLIADIRDICAENAITPRFEHILAQFNNIADRLSHNDFPQASALCLKEFNTPLPVSLRL